MVENIKLRLNHDCKIFSEAFGLSLEEANNKINELNKILDSNSNNTKEYKRSKALNLIFDNCETIEEAIFMIFFYGASQNYSHLKNEE